jgi:hypothetical protein
MALIRNAHQVTEWKLFLNKRNKAEAPRGPEAVTEGPLGNRRASAPKLYHRRRGGLYALASGRSALDELGFDLVLGEHPRHQRFRLLRLRTIYGIHDCPVRAYPKAFLSMGNDQIHAPFRLSLKPEFIANFLHI